MENYNAKGVLFITLDGKVTEQEVIIDAKSDIFKVFEDASKKVETLNVSKYMKVFYCIADCNNGGIAYRATVGEDTEYIPYRALCLLCDDEVPINMTEEALTEFRELLGVS